MSHQLKVGIIGVGHIGRSHLKSFAACEQAEVVAIADVNEAALRAVAEEYHVPRAFTDYRDLLQLDVDAVSICTPPFAHHAPTVAAAQAGKHVLVEKPMCMSAAEARDMVEACQRANVKLGICHARARFSPVIEAARQFVVSGALGDIYYARVSSLRRRGRPGLDILIESKWFLDSTKAGGGTLADIGCYNIDVLLYLLGSPQPIAVSAMTFRGVGQQPDASVVYDVEEHATVFVRFVSGATAVFESAWASNMDGGDGFRLFGTKGGLKTDPFTVYTEQHGMQVDITPQIPHRRDSGNELILDFVHACLYGTSPKTPGEDGLKVMQIIDAAYRSARLGREVRVEEVG
ncbi:MAG: Gfo/Idh/MocA family oxidoreductase [Abditibacteriales bacterium]|nr:Gfo/Idh/MocA family oxidoreductase [Abditibacteriales bacterium]MDW8366371.1 Gfo/Idh/MocA family oxidoreductase [Abditibacteriales bacterium]